MTELPKSVRAIARIPRVLALLSAFPDGLPLPVVADRLSADPEELRRDILRFYAMDIPADALIGLGRPDVIEFLANDGSEADPSEATIIRVVSDRPAAELGVEYVPADRLAELYTAARGLAETEPDNVDLAHAVATLAGTFLEGLEAQPHDPGSVSGGHSSEDAPDSTPAILRKAMDERRTVRIRYSREWKPGVDERVIHPYALRRTRRGWEVDAGPVRDGHPRTFIVGRIQAVQLTAEVFERPEGIDAVIAEDRREQVVQLCLPQGTQWVADRFAERCVVTESDRQDLSIRAGFLPPVRQRVALVLTITGSDAFVVDPPGLNDGAAEMAERLLTHHGLG